MLKMTMGEMRAACWGRFSPCSRSTGADTPPGVYRQRGVSSLQRLFRALFAQLTARYEAKFAKRLGKFRLERITNAVERFLACGDYRRSVARIKCTNPDCQRKAEMPLHSAKQKCPLQTMSLWSRCPGLNSL